MPPERQMTARLRIALGSDDIGSENIAVSC
jgi:hypothetical protein